MFSVFARTLSFILLIFKPISGFKRQNLNSVAVLLHADSQNYKHDLDACIFFDFLLKNDSEKRSKNRFLG